MCVKQRLKTGFSMAEALIAFMLIGLALAATIPLMTQMSQLKTGTDKNTIACITGDSFADNWVNTETDEETPPKWYDNSTGASSIPLTPPDRETELLKSQCHASILDTQFDRGRAADTAIWYTKHGTDTQKLLAKKILRAACDKGGKKACDYFINTCWHEGDSEDPSSDPNKMYCDDINSYLDLTYYLHLNRGANTNPGAAYIRDQLEGLLPKMIQALVNEVSYAKENEQLPKGGSYNPSQSQHLNNNIASGLAVAQIYIRGCNLGFDAACKTAWDPDGNGNPSDSYNTSCTAVKTNWAEAPTGNYRLTYPGNPNTHDPVEVYCNMSSAATAAVTGCNADPPVAGDCKVARANNYNRSCNQLYATFQSSFGCGNYTLTGAYEPPDYDYDDLETNQYCCNHPGNQCITDGIGSECDDGTIYAGEYQDGSGNTFHYFTSPDDEFNLAQMNYANNYGGLGCRFNANNSTYGMPNQQVLIAALNQVCNLYDDYDAVKACGEWLNGDMARNSGHTDWYLPALNELNLLYEKKNTGLLNGTFPVDIFYWSSTEVNDMYSAAIDFNTGTIYTSISYHPSNTTIRKELLRYVRCVRKQDVPNTACPDSGNQCPDQTIYVGMHGGKYIFTMPQNELGTYKWGAYNYSIPGAESVNDGYLNFIDVVNEKSKLITSLPAAQVCQRKNDNLDNNHDDWFLPSRGELVHLCTNKDKLNNFFFGTHYFSSTETGKSDANQLTWSNCSVSATSKAATERRAHCVRREPK